MRKLLLALAIPAALVGLSACAEYGYDEYAAGDYYSDGYYDNYYGPIYSGYWGPDDFYYYRTVNGPTVYVRDDARHFRRDTFDNGRRFHMRDHDWRDHRRDGDRR